MLPGFLFTLGPLWVMRFKAPSYLKVECYFIKWVYQTPVKARNKTSTMSTSCYFWCWMIAVSVEWKHLRTEWKPTEQEVKEGISLWDCSRLKYFCRTEYLFFFLFIFLKWLLKFQWGKTDNFWSYLSFFAWHFMESGLKSPTYLHYNKDLYS